MLKQIKKTLAVLLVVCFLATVTAGAVSAHAVDVPNHHVVHDEHPHHDHHKIVQKHLPSREDRPIPKPVSKPAPQPAPEHRL
jgi:hypothetical protein